MNDFPLLGFPEENKDLCIRGPKAERALYSCRPMPHIVAVVEVCVANREKLWIGIVPRGFDEPVESLLADCPLQAICLIKNYVDTHVTEE